MSSFCTNKIKERLKNYVPRCQEEKHQNTVINKYNKKNINIINTKRTVEHDGFDQYGPQSNLYDFYIYYRIGYHYYIDIWHREDWYSNDDDDPYSLWSNNNLFSKKEKLL
jgi:hypothetical protein|tara:strand:- start:110 stop:439 length:330 start_codon:yes stop_codon:yes gene_type:complete